MAKKPENTRDLKRILNERGEKICKPTYEAPPNPFKKKSKSDK